MSHNTTVMHNKKKSVHELRNTENCKASTHQHAQTTHCQVLQLAALAIWYNLHPLISSPRENELWARLNNYIQTAERISQRHCNNFWQLFAVIF